MKKSPFNHLLSFGIIAFLTLSLWFCFGWFREQFCIIVCPYGRLQSVLTDDDTVIIGYDEKRGEPRGAKGKVTGSCIDCRRCVSVCPTGIDIRNGLQLECIGCAACIDACDDIMLKIQRPTGLIRYDSLKGLAGEKRRFIRPRVLLYTVLGLLGLTAFLITALNNARPYTADFSRMKGPAFYSDPAAVRNLYQVRFHNKRNQEAHFRIELIGAPEGYTLSGGDKEIMVPPQGEMTRAAIVLVPVKDYHGAIDIQLKVIGSPGTVEILHQTRFLGPASN